MDIKKQSWVVGLGSWVLRVLLVAGIFVLPITHPSRLTTALASVRQEVYVTGTVYSFGGYEFSKGLRFEVTEPGYVELGRIVIDGLYNGEYPWTMRAYTDNTHFSGLAGAVYQPKPAGAVSTTGQYVIPLEIHAPHFGLDVWKRIPDLGEPNPKPYQYSTSPGEHPDITDCIVMGIDPRNADWVRGPDGLLFTKDDVQLGTYLEETPYELLIRGDFSQASAQGTYETFIYFETLPAP